MLLDYRIKKMKKLDNESRKNLIVLYTRELLVINCRITEIYNENINLQNRKRKVKSKLKSLWKDFYIK